jgi:hypothetical protein
MSANLTYVTGHAGTGKTTRLMKMAGDLSESLITEPDFQCLLAVTHMHGARSADRFTLAQGTSKPPGARDDNT